MPEANPFLSIQLEAVELQEKLAGIDLNTADLGFVLHARRRLAGSGNRRKLFSVFDDFFSKKTSRVAVTSDTRTKGPVSLTRVSFRNWKVFANLNFELPYLDENKPVVLIGGNNGYGKTSFLEGILYCLFGRVAHAERARLLDPNGQTSTVQRAAGYKKFLDRAFHRPSRARGETTMLVRTEWQTADGPLCVERRWYLGDDDEVSVGDEVLMLWGGEDRDVVDVPEDTEASQFYQTEIERRLLSAGAASFMLFDAEQVHWFSDRGVDDQVRLVTERSFGLSEWKEAAADLRDYARDRGRRIEREVGAYDNQRRLLESLQNQLDELNDTAAILERESAVLRPAREALFAQIASLDQSSYETLQSLLERRQLLTAEHGRLSHEFASMAAAVLPITIIGHRQRGAVMQSLADDRNKAHEDFGVFGNERVLSALVERLRSQSKPIDSVENTISQLIWAWDKLAGEKDKAADLRYPFLTPALREALLARLHKHQDDLGRVRLVSETLAALSAELTDLNLKIDQAEARSEAIARHESELQHIGDRLHELKSALSELSIQQTKTSAERSHAIAMFEDDFGSATTDQGSVIRDALTLAGRIEDAASTLLPLCFEKVASALTENYLALSHKDVVQQVRISVSGQVELLDDTGNDLRLIEGSAGEKQIFAMALLAAISEFAPNRLPSIIDTPLGRLDPDHRQRLLRFFSSRPIQTIMLSQPNEINGTTLQLIEDRVAARFLLEHKGDSRGLGASQAREGYFDEVAA
ncbi:AAA family ATPase [Sinorhizobium fredii]|nr:AAA family ATPase [Sinorhizobium fredii]